MNIPFDIIRTYYVYSSPYHLSTFVNISYFICFDEDPDTYLG